MRKYLAGLAIACCAVSSMATDARVETMGGHHHFFKDDQSIFTNPATVADYDQMLMGSFGIYVAEDEDGRNNQQYNRDARRPYFGGTMSWGETEEKKSKFTVGAVLNRYDPLIRYITPDDELYFGNPKESVSPVFIDSLVGKVDLVMAATLNNGINIGISGYTAFQSQKEANVDVAMSRVVKGTIGMSGNVTDEVELEASVSIAALTLKGYEEATNKQSKVTTADDDIAVTIDVKAYTAMPKINGNFVPHIQANIINHHGDETLLDFNGGVGFNSFIDRGFFWGAIEGIYENDSYAIFSKYLDPIQDESKAGLEAYSGTGKRSRIGGRASFGIERNVLTDWLVWRVGASKLLAYEKLKEGDVASYWVENSEDDHVSFGMGVNIEDRFKVDAVVSENILYTFSNLFSGDSHHFSTKISATFNF